MVTRSKSNRTQSKSKKSASNTSNKSTEKEPSFENKWGWHPKPLKASFMAFSIIGFLVSVYMIFPKSLNWGFSFMLVFTIMFLASVISMTKAPVIKE